VLIFLYYVRTQWQIKALFFSGSICFYLLLQHNRMYLIRIVTLFVITVCLILFYELNFYGSTASLGLGLLKLCSYHNHLDTSQAVGLLCMSDRPVAESST
jgi:hypothetical protein